jgi:hypothetical protein
MRRFIVLPALALLGLMTAGCEVNEVSFNVHNQEPRPVYHQRVVHVDSCHHHHNCGHRYVDGRWIVVHDSPDVVVVEPRHPRRTVVVEEPPRRVVHVEHVHDAHCGCAWDGRVWITVGTRHVHGPGCGHTYIRGRWTIR